MTRSSPEEIEDSDLPTDDKEQEREAKRERLREDLLRHVSAADTRTIRQKVAWILNHYPSTRNSDVDLMLKYWFAFDGYDGGLISQEDLFRRTRLTIIARERAAVQNDLKLFLADKIIREKRGTLAEDEKERAKEKALNYPKYAVFYDESGKNSDHLVVGSLWFLTEGTESLVLHREAAALKKRANFKHEFHFSEMARDEVSVYKEFVDLFLNRAGTISVKVLSLPRRGNRDIDRTLDDLVFHLIKRGIDHEISTGRAVLPRSLDVWKDREEEGSDKIRLANLKSRLETVAESTYNHNLYVDSFFTADSKANYFIQFVDIVTGSAGRVLNRTEGRNHKDELADYVVARLNLNPTSTNDHVGDMGVSILL